MFKSFVVPDDVKRIWQGCEKLHADVASYEVRLNTD